MNYYSHPCIVTFIGPVGVGKSTQIMLMKNYLRSRRVRACTTFIKSSHALTYMIRTPLMLLGLHEENRLLGRRIIGRLLRLWSLLDSVSIAAKFLLTVYIPFKLGFNVLIEEGLMMTLFTYNAVFPQFYETKSRSPSLVLVLLGWTRKQNHVNIILDAVDEELVKRRKSRRYRRSELPEYVTIQRRWIKHLNSANTVLIETSGQSSVCIHRKISSVLERLIVMAEK